MILCKIVVKTHMLSSIGKDEALYRLMHVLTMHADECVFVCILCMRACTRAVPYMYACVCVSTCIIYMRACS